MLSSRNAAHLLLALSVLLWTAALPVSSSPAQQDDSVDGDVKKTAIPGGRTFNSTCAGCHGLDGRGSDKGANIAGSVSVRRLSDADVSAIISKGVPGTGMPAFHNLSARQIGLLVSYLRILQGKFDARIAPRRRNPWQGNFLWQGRMLRLPHDFRRRRIPRPRPLCVWISRVGKGDSGRDRPAREERCGWLPIGDAHYPRW